MKNELTTSRAFGSTTSFLGNVHETTTSSSFHSAESFLTPVNISVGSFVHVYDISSDSPIVYVAITVVVYSTLSTKFSC